MKKIVFLFVGILAVVLAGCATTPQGGVPSEISLWQSTNPNTIHGIGISTHTNESHAFRQARTQAASALAANMEVRVATIVQDAVRFAQAEGMEDEVIRFQENTMQLIQRTINNAMMVGPYVNNIGNTYVVLYVDITAFDSGINDYRNRYLEIRDRLERIREVIET